MEPTINQQSLESARPSAIPRVLVATTAMLTFISFWRAAAIVLNDLASSAYYAGGEAERYIGKTAPWFILAIMLFSYAVRAIYVESCSMFVRGGVYRVVKEALGGTLAKFSVSALMFDYILTGPISGVSAGQYLAGLINEFLAYVHFPVAVPVNGTAAAFAVVVTFYFWWQNIKGFPESSHKALRIMQFTTVMVVLLIGWCGYTLWVRGGHLPPLPSPRNLRLGKEALGWLYGSRIPQMFGFVAILVGLGHSVLAMSGEESLAQVYREIESPKLPNLKKAGLVIFIYSLVFTSLVSIFTVMISRGNVSFLANLYAFGVIWSFAMKGVAVLVLRYTHPGEREYRVPLNLKLGGVEIPVGLALITLVLLAIAIVNLFTKPEATVAGFVFSVLLFGVFLVSERSVHKRGQAYVEMDQFHVAAQQELSPASLGVKPANILVPVSNYHALYHLAGVLDRIKPGRKDVVVLHVRLLRRAGSGESELEAKQLFGSIEQYLFTQALCLAERRGKSIRLAVVAATDKIGRAS